MRKKRSRMAKRAIDSRAQTVDTAVKTIDAFSNAMTRSGFGMPNHLEATAYPLTRYTQNWQEITSLYRTHWVVQRIINTIPQDMLKNGYDIKSDLEPDQIQKLTTCIRNTRTHAKILEGLSWGRLFGGAAGIILIEGEGGNMEEPLDLDRIMPKSFKGLLLMDRWSGISPCEELITDLDNPDFGLPAYYNIYSTELQGGQRIHHSRVCRFVGREMPYLEKLAEQYWGTSELEHVIEELRKRDNVSWNIALLTFMANIRVFKMEGMENILSAGSDQALSALYNTLEAMNMMLNNNGMQILGENDSYESHQYAFGGLGEVYDRFMMDVSGACGIPVTKLFGRSPAGMNATGDADMQNYYDIIESAQEAQLRPILDKLLPIICVSELGAVPDDLDYTFNPVRRSNDMEKQDLGSKQTTAVVQAFEAGLISQRTALQELQQSSKLTGMWTNITDDVISTADDDVSGAGEDLFGNAPSPASMTTDADFDESKHKRDKDGKFGNGGGSDNNQSVDKEVHMRYTTILQNTKTSDGVVVKSISNHAAFRFSKRNISPNKAKNIMMSQDTVVKPGNTARTTTYDSDGIRVVLDNKTGNIVTVAKRKQAKKRRVNNG